MSASQMDGTPTAAGSLAAPSAPGPVEVAGSDESVLADVLVEEISIDGMCGVY